MKNEYTIHDDVVHILIKSKGEYHTTLVDLEDLGRIDNEYRSLNVVRDRSSKLYVEGRTFNNDKIKLHRFIMNAPVGRVVDHMKGDGLDNRKSKMRVVTQALNAQNKSKKQSNNTSGVTGLWLDKRRNRWQGEIAVDGVKEFIGSWAYDDLDSAKEYMKEIRREKHTYYAEVSDEKL